MTTSVELEYALTHLQRAEELARFYQHPEEIVKLIGMLKRGTEKVKKQISARVSTN